MHKSYTLVNPSEYYLDKRPELLFVQYNENIQDKTRTMHAHDFWQLEFLIYGNMEVKSKNKKLQLESNDCVLIPPGIIHRTIYGKWKQNVWSFKFNIEMKNIPDRIILLGHSAASMNARNNILQLLSKFDTTCDSYVTLQSLLGMLIELEFQQNEVESGSAFVAQLTMLIDSYEGRPVSINELVDQLKCSRNTVSKKFHNESGITLKSFIDSRRLEIARKMLLYSNQKIVTIAEIMGFTDIYSFSRFFNHHQGCSPRKFKNKEQISEI